ncbi:alpha/beta hydrolase [Candidatus Micrarchaeota archaeon]|nr:alpha/beta hydrolase [Candidatus Micrarchaeota archaeon]
MNSRIILDNGKTRIFYTKKNFKTSRNIQLEYIFVNRDSERTLVFVSGWALRHSQWKSQMHKFPRYNLLFFNNRGHGLTEMGKSTAKTYLDDCASDACDLALHLDLSKITLVAHSMGTLISTIFCG